MATEYKRLKPETTRKENPKKNASIFSILSFWWVQELLAIGNKRPLENDDLFPLLDEDKTQTSTEKLQQTWNEEKTRCASNERRNGHRLLKALFRMFSCTDYMFVLSTGLVTGVCDVLQPVLLSLLLPELIKSSANSKGFSWAYIYAAGICLTSLVRICVAHQYRYNTDLMSVRWKSAAIGMIYGKVSSLADEHWAFHKLLEISQKVARNFSKSCSKVAAKIQKSCF